MFKGDQTDNNKNLLKLNSVTELVAASFGKKKHHYILTSAELTHSILELGNTIMGWSF